MTSPGDASVGRFLTVSDTAEILSITVSEATDLVRSGELPAIRVGASGLWRVERTVLEAYIDAKYEESRRLALWLQADFAALPELSGGAIIRPSD
ncbi:helix-turn-helix domain-containing protein [Agromyces atrinae]|jgi:excisionase family DNA binding protein|uniref:DNA-binding protein n=1 Tax=Agromyces atrinae TaxID=592376 RepID=A0A4Q2MBB3_9MICO|nr:helix-turn-helix domain-containing protein [Agromyces atrinae]NYD66635.1 excisionase family DNA binding protein [Agromyces atrinae]RXZ87302.1 DNA-binding protein [Agromyces atrinae]